MVIIILSVSLIKSSFGSISISNVLSDTPYLRLSIRQIVSSIKKFLCYFTQKFFTGKLIVGNVLIVIIFHILIKIRYLLEKANQFKEEVCTNHFHFGFTTFNHRQSVLIKRIHYPQCAVTTLQATIKLKPFFVGIAPCSIYFKGFKQRTKVSIIYTATTFVGIIRTYFTIRPIGHRHPVHITIRTFQSCIS